MGEVDDHKCLVVHVILIFLGNYLSRQEIALFPSPNYWVLIGDKKNSGLTLVWILPTKCTRTIFIADISNGS